MYLDNVMDAHRQAYRRVIILKTASFVMESLEQIMSERTGDYQSQLETIDLKSRVENLDNRLLKEIQFFTDSGFKHTQNTSFKLFDITNSVV